MICLFRIMSIDFYKKVFIQVGAIFEVEGCLFFPSSSITVLLEEASQAHKRLLSLWKNLRGSTVIAALYLWISLGHLFNIQPTIHPTLMLGHLRAIDIKSSRPALLWSCLYSLCSNVFPQTLVFWLDLPFLIQVCPWTCLLLLFFFWTWICAYPQIWSYQDTCGNLPVKSSGPRPKHRIALTTQCPKWLPLLKENQ